jgi:hypothetical protein
VRASSFVDVPAYAHNDMQALLRNCAQMAAELPGGDIRVILSDSLVRYQCFAWRPKLQNATEDLAFAGMAFDDVYGTGSSAQWQLTFNRAVPGKSRLCVAAPKELLSGLAAVKDGSAQRVVSVSAAMCAVARAYRAVLPKEGWLVSEEGDRVTLGSWDTSGWTWLQTVRTSVNSPEELVDLIYQELQLASVPLSSSQVLPVLIHSPTLARWKLPATVGLQLMMVKPAMPGASAHADTVDLVGYAYAMLGRMA